LEDKSFLKEVANNSVIGKTYVFTVIKRGNSVVKAELFKE
jgi:hypothetical protein